MSSVFWKYFKETGSGNDVLCTVGKCNRVLKRKDKSTKTMWDHMKQHPLENAALKNGTENDVPVPEQTKITSHFDKKQIEAAKQRKADEQLVRIIVRRRN